MELQLRPADITRVDTFTIFTLWTILKDTHTYLAILKDTYTYVEFSNIKDSWHVENWQLMFNTLYIKQLTVHLLIHPHVLLFVF